MTNLKSSNIGMNKFCGPAVLAILTGKTTDECANVISKVNGQYIVTGVLLTDLLKAADRLGFDSTNVGSHGSLYKQLVMLARQDGIYIVTISNHFVVIEVKDKQIYFCDNHTKEPIPASSSARLMQSVVACHKVTKREGYVEPELPKLLTDKIEITSQKIGELIYVEIKRAKTYNYPELNTYARMADLTVTSEELHDIITKLWEINNG